MYFLSNLQALVSCYQAFEHYSAIHIKSAGLTLTQFDIIATLGNQPPMTFKQLGEKTLITKGTLCGVIERLTDKGLVTTKLNPQDGRSQFIELTQQGQQLFDQVFPEHLHYLARVFDQLDLEKIESLTKQLQELKKNFQTTPPILPTHQE